MFLHKKISRRPRRLTEHFIIRSEIYFALLVSFFVELLPSCVIRVGLPSCVIPLKHLHCVVDS